MSSDLFVFNRIKTIDLCTSSELTKIEKLNYTLKINKIKKGFFIRLDVCYTIDTACKNT